MNDIVMKRLRLFRRIKSYVESHRIEIAQYEEVLNNQNTGELMGYYGLSFNYGLPRSKKNVSPVECEVIAVERQKEVTRDMLKQWILDGKSAIYWLEFEVKKIETALNALDDKKRFIIEMKYFHGLTWDEVLLSYNEQFRGNIESPGIQKMNGEGIIILRSLLKPFYDKYTAIISDYNL